MTENENTIIIKTPLVIKDVIEGTAQLASKGVLEVTELVSAIHKEIVLCPFTGIAPKFIEDVYENTTGRIYDIIKYIMRLSGNTTETSLRLVNSHLPHQMSNMALPENANALISVLNGVMGDHLVTLENPLALPMLVYTQDSELHPLTNLSGRVVIFIHGLCINHKCWSPNDSKGIGHKVKQHIPDSTLLYLDYNTGKRISENGEALCELLAKIVANNPDISSIDIIGHSMGGLITRSAMFYATNQNAQEHSEQKQCNWLHKLNNYIAVCSPHHGAGLERLGYVFQDTIAKIPIAGNLARLGDLRSAGIIDLRHASIRHEDWQQVDSRMGIADDVRHATPLPNNVNTYFIGASIQKYVANIANKDVSDGLVNLASAMGEHTKEEHNLQVPKEQTAIFYSIDHINILQSDDMHQQVLSWLKNSS